MDTKKLFFETLKAEFTPKLREVGFLGSGQNFRRIRGEVINTLNVQGGRYGGKCALNVGLHLKFLPIWSEELPDPKTIREIDCEFRGRVTPHNEADYWWEYGDSPKSAERSALHLIDTYFAVGEPRFQRFSTVEAIAGMYPLTSLDTRKEEFVSDMPFGELPCTAARQALAMSRIHQHLGHHKLTREFAALGLEIVDNGTALIPRFQKIIDGIDPALTTGKDNWWRVEGGNSNRRRDSQLAVVQWR